MFSKYKIGDVVPYQVDIGERTMDNRWNYIETENSVVLETNGGHVAKGDAMEWSVKIWLDDWDTIAGYWESHTAISITYENGTVEDGWYLTVISYQRISKFDNHLQLKLKFRRL